MDSIVGKWSHEGHIMYTFFENGLFETTDPSVTLMGRYYRTCIRITFSIGNHTSVNDYELSGNILKLYPPDGGSPIVFNRVY